MQVCIIEQMSGDAASITQSEAQRRKETKNLRNACAGNGVRKFSRHFLPEIRVKAEE